MTRDEAIDATAAAVPGLLAGFGLTLPSVLRTMIVRVVAGLLRGLIPEDAPVVAVVDQVERVDDRP